MESITFMNMERQARAGLFMLALAIPLLGTVANRGEEASLTEHRPLAAAPGLPRTQAQWQDFPGALSAWFNDHFGFREQLLGWNHVLVKAAHMYSLSSAPVLEGRDGWLFFTGDRSLLDYQGRLRYTDAELARWAAALQQRQRWLAARGIPYLFVIAPNKQSIHPEFLPAWLDGRRGKTRADQLIQYLEARTDVPLLDLRPALLLEKGHEPLYRKYDTHWNARGAELGRRYILAALSAGEPKPAMPAPAENAWGERKIQGGDLARMMGRPDVVEVLPALITGASRCRLNTLRRKRLEVSAGQPLIDECATGGPVALVFRDSFMIALRPLLTPHFGRSIYLWKRPDFCMLRQLLGRYAPDVVIEQTTERFLDAPENEACAP